MLGEGVYDVYFADRGGLAMLGQVTAQFRLKIQWVRDDIGMCSITVTSPDDACCELLASLRTVRHEMVVFRNGERVWEGPITRIGYFADYVEVDARDIAWYLSRRLLELGFDHTGVSVNAVDTLYQTLLDHYPPTGDGGFNIGQFITKISSANDARTAAKQENYSKTMFELLNHYADNGGIDFVVRGRRIVVYDTHTRYAVLPQLSDADFAQSLGVVEYGSELNTRVASSNNNGLVSLAIAPQEWLDYYGYIDHLRSNEDEGADDPLTDEEKAAAEEALQTQ